jgi:hypothetical protein
LFHKVSFWSGIDQLQQISRLLFVIMDLPRQDLAMPLPFISFCSWCNTVVRQEVEEIFDYCNRRHCTNPHCVLFPDSRVTNTSHKCFVGQTHKKRCPHEHKACYKFCFPTFDGENATSKVYSCQKCYHIFCADCNPPVCHYPGDNYKFTPNNGEYSWDMNDRIQELRDNPFECPECNSWDNQRWWWSQG